MTDQRVVMVDDVVVTKDLSIFASESPSSSPTSSCLYTNMAINGNAETGLLTPYRSWGNVNAVIQTDDVYEGNYAFRFRAADNYYDGLAKYVDFRYAKQMREVDCITFGTKIHFEFKVRLVQETEPGEFVGLDCDPTSIIPWQNVGCPYLRPSKSF